MFLESNLLKVHCPIPHWQFSKQESRFFVEYQNFNNWYYGLSKEEFEDCDAMILNVEGLALLPKEYRERCFVIYLDIDHITRLKRLENRQDSEILFGDV